MKESVWFSTGIGVISSLMQIFGNANDFAEEAGARCNDWDYRSCVATT